MASGQYPIEYIHFDVIDSTQTYCRNNCAEFDLNKLYVVSADFQTAGRGTRNREWVADAGDNLLMSFVARFPPSCTPEFLTDNIPCTTKVLSLAVLEVLDGIIEEPTKAAAKWPNDILLNKSKIGGTVATCVPTKVGSVERFDTVILGVGVNVNARQETLDDIQRPVWPASSLLQELDRDFDVAQLRVLIAEKFYDELQHFFRAGFAHFKDRYTERDIFVGEKIKFRDGDVVKEGIFKAVGDRGEILVDLDGKVLPFFNLEIIPL